MNELQLEPGKKYRGTGWVNKYGEMHFRPQQKGSKPQNLHVIMEHEYFSIYESENIFKVTMKFAKADFSVSSATRKLMFVLSQLLTYVKK